MKTHSCILDSVSDPQYSEKHIGHVTLAKKRKKKKKRNKVYADVGINSIHKAIVESMCESVPPVSYVHVTYT